MPASSKRKPVSPIRFAVGPELSPAAAAQQSDGENQSEEEEVVDIGDELFTQYKWPANTRRSTSVVPMIAKPEQTASEDKPSGSVDPSQYTLIAFSTGQILDDQFAFEWFNLNPHELLELHSAGFLVNLPRAIPDIYISPYFEARVWALRAVSKYMDEIDGSGKKGDSHDNSPYGSDDRNAESQANKREKLAKKRRTKYEWRPRWVIVHQGILKLCKGRSVSSVLCLMYRFLRGLMI